MVASVAAIALVTACGTTGGGGGGALIPGQDGVADLVDQVKGAVVNIDQIGLPEAPVDDSGAPPPSEEIVRGTGSGFLVRADGLVVTNQHVVAGASKLRVTLSDGRKLDGRVVGTDAVTDLALVQVDGSGFPVLALADPASLRVGQFVVAMGSPLGLEQTVTWGLLSAINRHLSYNARLTFLQTDAPINPGNSGGPLLNMRGQVIGVNTAVARRSQGIGFAISVGTLQTVLPQLERTGHAAHAWLGISVGQAADGSVIVGEVAPDGPAARAGLQVGDRLVAIDGQPVTEAFEVITRIAAKPVGSTVELKFERDGRPLTLRVTLGDLPARPLKTPERFSVV
jgi:S1-C subfamily serine protease